MGCHRRIYERGVAYVGTDYNAHGLWDKYLGYEGYAGSSEHVAALYTRLLACPIKELDRYYHRCAALAGCHSSTVQSQG
jgi:pre-mRNA-processing factor 39